MTIKLAKHIFVILISCISYTAIAQNVRMQMRQENLNNRVIRQQNPGMRQVQIVKERFLSEQLNLNREQGLKFWPLYRQYQNEIFEVRRLKRLNNSDAQANGSEQVKRDLDYEGQLVAIRKHYYDEFMKVLPPEKISELIKGERQFTDELIKQVHEQKGGPSPQ